MDSECYQSAYSAKVCFSNNGLVELDQKYHSGEHIITAPTKPFIYSADELIDLFNSKPFFNLYNIIFKGQDKEFNMALSTLYSLVNVPSSNSQLLGSITSIEILLKNGSQENYKKIISRISLLLGDEIIKEFNKDDSKSIDVFEIRHKMIHEGRMSTDKNASYAIKLASYVIIACSYIYNHFQNKASLCMHLDMINNIMKDNCKEPDPLKIIGMWEKIKFDTSILNNIINIQLKRE